MTNLSTEAHGGSADITQAARISSAHIRAARDSRATGAMRASVLQLRSQVHSSRVS